MKKKPKKLLRLILVIVILILVCLAAFMVYKKLTMDAQAIRVLRQATIIAPPDVNFSTYGWTACCCDSSGCCWEYFNCQDNSCDCEVFV